MTEYKQALVLRDDLDMSSGKAVAQGAHVSVKAVQSATAEQVANWKPSMAKITLKVDGRDNLQYLATKADENNLPHATIVDEGRTELDAETLTALAIGPAPANEVDAITGNLSLY